MDNSDKKELLEPLQAGTNKNILCNSCEYGARAVGYEAWECILNINIKKTDKVCYAHANEEQHLSMYKKWREDIKFKGDLQTFLKRKSSYK